VAKKRLGEPLAAQIADTRKAVSYRCPLCGQWHTGDAVGNRLAMETFGVATVEALRADPRVGWRGLIALADAWAPDMSERERWSEGLDQQVACVLP
jgi:hypothetical protein